MLQTICRFRPIGQGLFYTGDVDHVSNQNFPKRRLTFIYDVGCLDKDTINKSASLNSEIDKLVDEQLTIGQNIDFLAISHLDKDHLSGVQHLVRQLKKADLTINHLVLPYSLLQPGILTRLYAWSIYGVLRPGIIDIVEPNYGDDPESIGPLPRFEIDDFPAGVQLHYLRDDNADGQLSIQSATTGVNVWNFYFFTPSPDIIEGLTNNDINKLQNNLTNLMKMNNLPIDPQNIVHHFFDATFTDTLWKSLEDVYSNAHLRSKTGEKDWKNFSNVASMLLLHGPIRNNSNNKATQWSLLTGDAKFNFKDTSYLDAVKSWANIALNSNKGEIRYFQVPHHGAALNWGSKTYANLKPLLNNTKYYFVSAGLLNNSKHPSKTTIGDILDKAIEPAKVIQVSEKHTFITYWGDSKDIHVRAETRPDPLFANLSSNGYFLGLQPDTTRFGLYVAD